MNKTWWYMALWGIVRTVLSFLASKLQDKGLIDAETGQRIVSEGVTDVVGWLLLFVVMFWSVIQKSQAWARILAALHINPRTGVTNEVIHEVKASANAPNVTL